MPLSYNRDQGSNRTAGGGHGAASLDPEKLQSSFGVIIEHEACNMGGNAARIEIKRMGSGLRDGFDPHAALGSPFLRRLGGGPSRGPGSFRVPHYLTQDHRDLGAFKAQTTNEYSNSRYLEFWDRQIEDPRKAGMPED